MGIQAVHGTGMGTRGKSASEFPRDRSESARMAPTSRRPKPARACPGIWPHTYVWSGSIPKHHSRCAALDRAQSPPLSEPSHSAKRAAANVQPTCRRHRFTIARTAHVCNGVSLFPPSVTISSQCVLCACFAPCARLLSCFVTISERPCTLRSAVCMGKGLCALASAQRPKSKPHAAELIGERGHALGSLLRAPCLPASPPPQRKHAASAASRAGSASRVCVPCGCCRA